MRGALVPDLRKELEKDQKEFHLGVPSRSDSPVVRKATKRVLGEI